MNRFDVICPGCRTLYQDIVVDGLSLLLHKGLRNVSDSSSLPTPRCVRVYNYVEFLVCRHCCPETFADCPICILEHSNSPRPVGKPTNNRCFCD